MTQTHELVHIEYKGKQARVDAGMAELILEIWKLDINTMSCCENRDESLARCYEEYPHVDKVPGMAYIDIAHVESIVKLYDILINKFPHRDHWLSEGHWQVLLHTSALNFGNTFWYQWIFPTEDIAPITSILKEYNGTVSNLHHL